MSTSATITITDNHETFHIYRHCDGNPSSVITDLIKAKTFAWPLPRFEASDFAAAIVAAMKQEGGGQIYLSQEAALYEVDYHYIITLSDQKYHLSVIDIDRYESHSMIFDGTFDAAMNKFLT